MSNTTQESALPDMQHVINQAQESVKVMELFALKYGAKLPKELVRFSLSVPRPFCFIRLGYTNEDRDRALSVVGEVFGRADWTASRDRHNDCFNWDKTLDGVNIYISGAQKFDQPEKFPVDPKQFPLQLT